MRLKKVKGALEIVSNSDYVIKEPKKYRGKYKSLFGNNNSVHIEIGSGKGDFIINMAKAYPSINFIGIEKYDSVLCKIVNKLELENIKNLKLICMDAIEIDEVFNKEIDTLYLNFSDPWPKKRHAKRRLTSPNLLKKYDGIFKDKPHIILKTDNRGLFEYSLVSLSNYGYIFKEVSLDYNDENNVETEYEKKFRSKGMPIYHLEAILYDKFTVKEK